MANIYSGMTQKQKDNERKYLSDLQTYGSAGDKAWATSQLKQLDSSGSSSSSSSSSKSSASTGAVSAAAGVGTGVSAGAGSTSSSKKTSSSSKSSSSSSKSSSSSNKSSGVTSMYKNDTVPVSTNSVSIADRALSNVINIGEKYGLEGSTDNIKKTDSGWYLPSSSSSSKKNTVEEIEEVNPYEQKYNELQEAYKKQQEQMNANNSLYEQKYNELQGLLSSNQEKYDELLGSLNSYEQKYNDLLNAPNPYEQKYNDLQKAYEEQEEAIREQNRLAVEQGVNRLNSQKSNINQSAEDNARQAYIMHMQAQKALPQQLASQGVTGGATETANLGLSTTYQNNLNDINRNKINALQDIDNAIVDLQNTGDLSTVEQVLTNNQMALDAYMNNLDKQVGYNQWAAQFNANRADTMAEQAYRDKVYADQMAQQQFENNWYEQSYKDKIAQDEMDAYNDAVAEQNKLLANQKEAERDNILKLYSNGQIDRSYAAALLGIPEEYLYDQMGYLTANNQLNLKDKQVGINNTQSLISNRNNGSSGGSSGTKGNQTYTQVLSAIQDINTTSGEDYSENLAAARYLLNSDLTMENKVKIMKQTNVRPEAYVREMFNEGKSDEDIMKFVEEYTPNQEYRNSLFVYAHQ